MTDYCELIGPRASQRARFSTCLTVGRHPTNDLRLQEPAVSSFHAVIEWVEDGWYVRDLGSRNGTSLNGRRLQGRASLSRGDVLRFARGPAWRVERLAAKQGDRMDDHGRTSGLQRSLPEDLRLELRREGPGEGSVCVSWGEQAHEFRGKNAYLLLDSLARTAGTWVTDGELRSLLWGRRGERMSRSALHQLIYNTRRVFEGWGLDGGIIEKEQGATRLNLADEQVERSGEDEPKSPFEE